MSLVSVCVVKLLRALLIYVFNQKIDFIIKRINSILNNYCVPISQNLLAMAKCQEIVLTVYDYLSSYSVMHLAISYVRNMGIFFCKFCIVGHILFQKSQH
uniref:Uncharacterized protein n=1 Tax=Populus davidiana TaxID=266767 RepID=A0A6M2EEJ9_9ROSI